MPDQDASGFTPEAVPANARFLFGTAAGGWDVTAGEDMLAGLHTRTTSPELRGEGAVGVGLPGRGATVVIVGDSNSVSVEGYHTGIQREMLSAGGVLEGATLVNLAASGTKLKTWADSIATGDGSTDPGTATSLWAAVNNNPDVILFWLGVNDVNSVAARAAEGTLANLRANLATCLRFLLDHSTATIIVQIPQASFAGGADITTGIPAWGSSAVCNAAQDDLCTVHREWIGRSPRVIVVDWQKWVGADHNVDPAADQLDPVTGAATMVDALHGTNLGKRRRAELAAHALSPVRQPTPRQSATVLQAAEASYKTAYDAIHFWSSSRSGVNIGVELSPQMILGGRDAILPTESRLTPVTALKDVELLRACANYPILKRLSALPAVTGGYGLVYWKSGRSYTFDSITFSTLTGATPDQAVFALSGLSPSLDAGDTDGPCTLFVKDLLGVPFGPYSHATAPDLNLAAGASVKLIGTDVSVLPVKAVYLTRGAYDGGSVTVDITEATSGDGGYNYEEYIGGGKVIARGTLSAGLFYGVCDLDPDGKYAGYPGSLKLLTPGTGYLRAVVTSGTPAVPITATVTWR